MILELAFLFTARMADMCLATLRQLFVVRGLRGAAAIVALAEVLIYTTALGLMLSAPMDGLRIAVFSAGYALGVYLGSVIEGRLALGHRLLSVTVDGAESPLANDLRQAGCAVTAWTAQGMDGAKTVMHVLVPRRLADRIAADLRRRSPAAFVVLLEPRGFLGGGLMHPMAGIRLPAPAAP